MKILFAANANRPRESAADRLRWIAWTEGRSVDPSPEDESRILDAVDYRGQPSEYVVADCQPDRPPPVYDWSGVRIGRLAINATGLFILAPDEH